MISIRHGALIPFLAVSLAWADPTPEQLQFFENKVRPILSENCYKCHSVEKGAAKGGLTVDSAQAMLQGGETGPALVPGDPEKSLFIRAIRYTDPELQMPKKYLLKDDEVATLTEWVKMGAPDPRKATGLKLSGLNDAARKHWAYQPVTSKSAPMVKNPGWCESPVDRFILSRLEEKSMVPSPRADKETLIRRAYYDLIGLPPSPQEIETFRNDKNPNAFAKVVDHLLDSPHYGERWGRHWLDTARYSDTVGASVNIKKILNEYRYPYAWSYRDYVIHSFNQDKPYNRFIIEQLAADKLPETSKDPTLLAALGFLTVGERFDNVQDELNERIDTVSKGFLGLTVSCARCHDHPFDPIPITDYYALHGVFSSTMEPRDKPLIREPMEPEYSEFLKKLAVLESKNQEAYLQIVLKLNSLFLKNAPSYLKVLAQSAQYKKSLKDSPKDLPPELRGTAEAEFLRVLNIEVFRRSNDDSVFGPLKLLAEIPDTEFERKAPGMIQKFLLRRSSTSPINPRLEAALKLTPLKSRQDLIALYAKLFAEAAPLSESVIRNIFAGTPLEGASSEVAPFLQFPLTIYPAKQLTAEELRRLVRHFPPPLEKMLRKIKPMINLPAISYLELTDPGSPERAMTVTDVPKPHDDPVFIRGQAQVRGEIVPRRFLTILTPDGNPKPFREGSGRLELAQAIAKPENPLTARTMVNRVWMWHFGAGLVPTPDNLGTQSEAPSHPELLDFLSASFVENGWSIKALHRQIMLSSVYQQSSDTNPKQEELDPQNRFLWRANIRRLDFESLRDSLIAFSGKMDATLGGKPVNLVDEPYSYRRSVYGYIDRGNLPELMAQFDFSNPDSPNSQRNSTVVPQQSLFFMNSPMIIGVTRDILARPEVAQSRGEDEKITALYRIILQRTPQPQEIALSRQFLQSLKNQASDAKPAPPSASLDKSNRKIYKRPKETIQNEGTLVVKKSLSPWEALTQSLIFLNEMLYLN